MPSKNKYKSGFLSGQQHATKEELEFLKTCSLYIREYFEGSKLKENIKVKKIIQERIKVLSTEDKTIKKGATKNAKK